MATENTMIEFLDKQEKRLRDLEDQIAVTDNTMIAYLEKQEKRLQELEGHLAGKDQKSEQKQGKNEVEKFIELMKSVNSSASTNKIESESNEDEFIKVMKSINQ
ncbi:MAG: hypothetical protein P1P83_02910 [Bacteroidales bacterium]|nr:hypothetical protein [Bacteroidales bacterium]